MEEKPTALESTRNAIAEAIGDPATPTADNAAPVVKDETTAPSADPEKKAEPVVAAAKEPEAKPAEVTAKAAPESKQEEIKPEDKKEWQVPGERLQEEVKKRKELEDRLAALEAKPTETKPAEEEEIEEDADLTPAALKALKKQGFVTREEAIAVAKAELENENKASAYREQVRADMAEIGSWAKDKGYPEFDAAKVNEWADTNLGKDFVQNKTALKAAYMQMNMDDIREADIKVALAANGNTASAERPGAAAKTPAAVAAGGTEGGGWKDQVASVVDSSGN